MPINKKNQAKQIEELQAQLAQQERQLAQQKVEIVKYKEAEKAREFEKENRIPRPSGQAGRGNGYKLSEEMGVSKNTYHALRTIIRHMTAQYLDVTKSFRKQDRSRIRTTQTQIGRKLPFIRKYYHGLWPIHPIMKQYLSSSSKAYRKAEAYLENLEEVPALFTDLERSTTGTKSGNSGKGKKSIQHSHGIDSGHESDRSKAPDSMSESSDENEEEWVNNLERLDEDLDEHRSTDSELTPPPRLRKTGNNNSSGPSKKKNLGALEVDIRDAREARNIPSNPKVNNSRGSKQGNHVVFDMTPENASPVERGSRPTRSVLQISTTPGPISPSRRTDYSDGQTVNKGKYPRYCPNYEFCKEEFPDNPTKQIEGLYRQYKAVLLDPDLPRHRTSGEPVGSQMQLMLLCNAITTYHRFQNTVEKWPVHIDFAGLRQRILKLNAQGEIWALLDNDIVLHGAAAWRSLLTKIASVTSSSKKVNGKTITKTATFRQWSNMESMRKFSIAGDASSAGYYGPSGLQIILATLQHDIYAPIPKAIEALTTTISDFLEARAYDNADFPAADFWTGSNPTMLPLLDFMTFVAAPHVANLLIAEDQSVLELEADQIRLESNDHGKFFHDSDNSIDDIAMQIAAPRHQPNLGERNYINHDTDVGMPARLARKTVMPDLEPATIGQKRSHEKENDTQLNPATKKRKKAPRAAEELRRSLRHRK